jgi:hydroxymethylglutaryl-CoA lyase
MHDRVTIYEVSPRDGLQNEPQPIATPRKIALVDLLSGCGFSHIEVASFVNPKLVPQMADGAAVLAGIARRPGVVYAALAPNLKGYAAAQAAGADEVAIFASASESFSRRNINCGVAESLARFAPVAEAAAADGMSLRGYVSCVTDCPFEGAISPQSVAYVTEQLFALGCRQVSLGDTIGHGTPDSVERMLRVVLESSPAGRLAGHFHDTRGRALENMEVALGLGIRVFDAAAGGLGGCPFAPGAEGNVATERVVARLETLGFATGIDPARLAEAAAFARRLRSPA